MTAARARPLSPKHQRLILVLLALAALTGAALLALSGLKSQVAFFYAPGDVAREAPPVGRAVRLGGMVQAGSVQPLADGLTIRFVVGDGLATVPVLFRGVPPDLFREQSGVVAEGAFRADGSFLATNLLAKHDEKYMPPELAGKMHETKSLQQ